MNSPIRYTTKIPGKYVHCRLSRQGNNAILLKAHHTTIFHYLHYAPLYIFNVLTQPFFVV